jgi:hypothetical protein
LHKFDGGDVMPEPTGLQGAYPVYEPEGQAYVLPTRKEAIAKLEEAYTEFTDRFNRSKESGVPFDLIRFAKYNFNTSQCLCFDI